MAEYTKCPDNYIFGLDIGTRSIVGTVGYRENETLFKVVAQVVKMHETRSMLDGQIHDIEKVAESIYEVRKELEDMLQMELDEVCIAAAGRVLKTVNVRADYEFEDETVVDEECIHTLELIGMEKAYDELKKDSKGQHGMYCVGSTAIHYYLDDYIMLNLEGHKGRKISADFLATFLPDEVIESLYAAVEKAKLSVANLTLEPIAASEVAIPVNFRLLNIALVDVGAGTSDISITKDGSIIGYGMIPFAGDEFTEEIAKRYLVDFQAAEKIKMDCFSKKSISYKDIMGIHHKIPAQEILDGLSATVDKITCQVAEKIKELNGGSAVSAVFIVGGGGKLPQFAEKLANHLELPSERVAVRGKEVFANVEFMQEDIVQDSTLVTPVGICLSYYSKNNNFIMVSVNGRQIKLYDNNKLTVMDAAIQIGFPKENLFPKRGASINLTINNEKRLVRGEAGEGASIHINGKQGSFNTKIAKDDIIEIVPSTTGKDAVCKVGELPEYKRKGSISIYVNNKEIICPRMVRVNGEIALEQRELNDQDQIEILDYYDMEQLLSCMDMPEPSYFFINQKDGEWDDRIYDGFEVECHWQEEQQQTIAAEQQETDSKVQEKAEAVTENVDVQDEEREDVIENIEPQVIHDITVVVNEENVTLHGKAAYILVDILDEYPSDTSKAGGTTLVITINGMPAEFSDKIKHDDKIELYWKN